VWCFTLDINLPGLVKQKGDRLPRYMADTNQKATALLATSNNNNNISVAKFRMDVNPN